MHITYDPYVDVLYVLLRDEDPVDGVDIEDGVTVELGRDGHIVALEILDATERLGHTPPMNVPVEWLVDEPNRARTRQGIEGG